MRLLQLPKYFILCLLLNLAACSVVTLSDKPAPVTSPQQPPVVLPFSPLPSAPVEVVPAPEPPQVQITPSPEPELPVVKEEPPTETEAPAPAEEPTPAAAPVTSPEAAEPEPTTSNLASDLSLPETHENSPPSLARDPKSYRQDAARHLYRVYAKRIFKGKLPPLLKAVGVVDVLIGPQGQVLGIQWVRRPRQGPELIAEIESMIKRAAPYPVPVNLRKLTYTETWLWHASGRFQLDTLSEGQK